MFRFRIRDVLWLTVVVAFGVGWWLDRSQLAIPAAEYRRLKAEEAEEAERLKQRIEFFELLRAQTASPVRIIELPPSDGLRHVPGERDYQFPLTYPLHRVDDSVD